VTATELSSFPDPWRVIGSLCRKLRKKGVAGFAGAFSRPAAREDDYRLQTQDNAVFLNHSLAIEFRRFPTIPPFTTEIVHKKRVHNNRFATLPFRAELSYSEPGVRYMTRMDSPSRHATAPNSGGQRHKRVHGL
jgi:hypothetical protein